MLPVESEDSSLAYGVIQCWVRSRRNELAIESYLEMRMTSHWEFITFQPKPKNNIDAIWRQKASKIHLVKVFTLPKQYNYKYSMHFFHFLQWSKSSPQNEFWSGLPFHFIVLIVSFYQTNLTKWGHKNAASDKRHMALSIMTLSIMTLSIMTLSKWHLANSI
jgi:hypothetical protein